MRPLSFVRLACHCMLSIFAVPLTGQADNHSVADMSANSASNVRISEVNGRAVLMVDSEQFSVNGAGMGYRDEAGIKSLAMAGGNAFRTWDTENLGAQLDAAHRHGLMVLAGLGVGKQLQGFDYADEEAVNLQHTRLLSVVRRYKDHPSLLGWILGNEPNLMVNEHGQVVPADAGVYSAIGDLARDIEVIDPQHPTTVAFAFTSTLAEDIKMALTAAPDLKFISLQAYGALPAIPQLVADLKLTVPFMITEYGPLGHWETPSTQWGREIEEPSGHKARGLRARMQGSVIDDPTQRLLGSFAFLWGQKQERTPTWYGLFLASGERTSSVDELTHVWTGRWPNNRAPAAWSLTLQGQSADRSVTVSASEIIVASAHIDDPENDQLQIRWELLEEVDIRSHGGHYERTPSRLVIDELRESQNNANFLASFKAPARSGEYRLFVYAFDDAGGAATANFPFKVLD